MNTRINCILGIDPGLNSTGLAILSRTNDEWRCTFTKLIKTNIVDEIPKRLGLIYKSTEEVISMYNPDVCVLESGLVNVSATSSMKLAYGFAATALAAQLSCAKVISYCPKTIKRVVTNNGNASKIDVKNAINSLIKLDSTTGKIGYHEYDAIAIALCHIKAPEKELS